MLLGTLLNKKLFEQKVWLYYLMFILVILHQSSFNNNSKEFEREVGIGYLLRQKSNFKGR